MAELITIVKGKHGGANLCERCAIGTRIDDSQGGLYVCHEHLSKPTLRHRREDDERVRLSPGIQWDGETPEYPTLSASVVAGRELCAFVRNALLRCNVEWRGQVSISFYYSWQNGKVRSFIVPK